MGPVKPLAEHAIPATFWADAGTVEDNRNAELEPAVIKHIRDARIDEWENSKYQTL